MKPGRDDRRSQTGQHRSSGDAAMAETMTGRQRIQAALTGQTPDRIPRVYSPIPGFLNEHPGVMERLEQQYPQDVGDCGWRPPEGATRGDPYAVGTYYDEWGCPFENVHPGIVGQVKEPLIRDYKLDVDNLQAPLHLVDHNMDAVEAGCAATDKFTLTPWPVQPFERMQFLRGTEQLFKDLVKKPDGLFALRDKVHAFNVAWVKSWSASPVDCLFMADDWGTQTSLLISPKTWRELFKPLYAEYIQIAKDAGKFVYMHSDGFIIDILDDLVEIGLDAVNAQVTCMDLSELGKRFGGRLTFWGQMDRQHMLCYGTPDDARRDVQAFYEHLATPQGSHCICQMHIEPGAQPANIEAVLEAFSGITPGG
jgi:uroporphyrinogen decarboxylase